MSDSEDPVYIVVDKVVENEDGGATYTFDMDDKAASRMANLGLEFTLYCAAYQLDLQYVLDNIHTLQKKD